MQLLADLSAENVALIYRNRFKGRNTSDYGRQIGEINISRRETTTSKLLMDRRRQIIAALIKY